MKRKRIWAIFSGVGFALIATATIETTRSQIDFNHLVTFVGLVSIGMGIVVAIYSTLLLFSSRDTFKSSGIYKVVRHPMYLGGIIWALGLIILSLPVFSSSRLVESFLGVICLLLASSLENKFNIEKFGAEYEKYSTQVPDFNFLKWFKNIFL